MVTTKPNKVHTFGPFVYSVACVNIGITGSVNPLTLPVSPGNTQDFVFPLPPTVATAQSLCPIIGYKFKQSSPAGVTQSGCPTADLLVACKTATIPLTSKQLYSVVFEITTTGGMVSTITVSIDVNCGTYVNIIPGSPLYSAG